MRMEHAAIYVNDLEAEKDFFVRYFGGRANDCYEKEAKGCSSYFLRFDDGSRLELMKKKHQKEVCPARESGFSHIAFRAGNKRKAIELTLQLIEDGYDALRGPRTTNDGCFESCILDREGNVIEITA